MSTGPCRHVGGCVLSLGPRPSPCAEVQTLDPLSSARRCAPGDPRAYPPQLNCSSVCKQRHFPQSGIHSPQYSEATSTSAGFMEEALWEGPAGWNLAPD